MKGFKIKLNNLSQKLNLCNIMDKYSEENKNNNSGVNRVLMGKNGVDITSDF